jgi:hypothetical protein
VRAQHGQTQRYRVGRSKGLLALFSTGSLMVAEVTQLDEGDSLIMIGGGNTVMLYVQNERDLRAFNYDRSPPRRTLSQ